MKLTRTNPEYAPLDASDARTLALATLVLDDALLDRYLRHQETYLAAAEGALQRGRPLAEALAEAHAQASGASGLTPREEGAAAAAVRTFCTHRHALALLERKLERLQGRGAGEAALAEVRAERARLDAMVPLHQRYGADAVGRLLARERALMDLHARTTHLHSRGG